MFVLVALSPLITTNHVMATPVKAQAATDVKLALLSPQTGELSAYTSGFEHAAALAVKDINANSMFAGKYNFSLTVYDTKTTPTGATDAMTQAVTDGVAFAVGAAGSSNTLAAASVAVSNQVPLISYASTSPSLTTFDDHAVANDQGYLWRTPPSDALQGQVIADLAHDAGFSSMVIVHLDNAYGSGLANSTKDEFTGLGGTVSELIPYAQTTTDFSTIVTQIIGDNPDIIVAISYATDGSLLFNELKTQEVGVPVIGADGVADAGIFSEAQGTAAAMEGYLLTKPTAKESTNSTAFAAEYAAAYPSASGDIYTGETYDAFWAGALAILNQSSTAGADIIKGLSLIHFDGVTGSDFHFDSNGDSSAGYYLVTRVECGTLNKVATWEGGSATYTVTDPFTYTSTCATTSSTPSTTSTSKSTGGGGLPFPVVPFMMAVAVIGIVSRKRKFLK